MSLKLALLSVILLSGICFIAAQEVKWQSTPATPSVGGILTMRVDPIQSLATPPFYVSLLGPVSGTRVLSTQPYTTTFTDLSPGMYTLQTQSSSCMYDEVITIEYCGYLSPTKPSLGLACESPVSVMPTIRVTEAEFPLLDPDDFPDRTAMFAVWGRDECLFDTGENGDCINSEVIYSLEVGTEKRYTLKDSESANIHSLYSQLPIIGALEYIPIAISHDPNFTNESTLLVCDSTGCAIALSANNQDAQSQLLQLTTEGSLNLYSIDSKFIQKLSIGQSPHEFLRLHSLAAGIYIITNETGTQTSKIFHSGQ